MSGKKILLFATIVGAPVGYYLYTNNGDANKALSEFKKDEKNLSAKFDATFDKGLADAKSAYHKAITEGKSNAQEAQAKSQSVYEKAIAEFKQASDKGDAKAKELYEKAQTDLKKFFAEAEQKKEEGKAKASGWFSK